MFLGVGSLVDVCICFVGVDELLCICGDFEVLSLLGMVGVGVMGDVGWGYLYLYMVVVVVIGEVFGGYVVLGCWVCIMVEVLLVLLFEWVFMCELDVVIGYVELVVKVCEG